MSANAYQELLDKYERLSSEHSALKLAVTDYLNADWNDPGAIDEAYELLRSAVSGTQK